MEQFPNSHLCCSNRLQHFLFCGLRSVRAVVTVLWYSAAGQLMYLTSVQSAYVLPRANAVSSARAPFMFIRSVSALMCEQWWGQCQPPHAAYFLARHTIEHVETTAIYACLAETQVFFSKTNTLQAASQQHTPYWQSGPASLQPPGLSRLALIFCMELIDSSTPVNWRKL